MNQVLADLTETDHAEAEEWRRRWRGAQVGAGDQCREYCADCLRPIVVPRVFVGSLVSCEKCRRR